MNIAEIEMQLSDLVSEPLDKSEFVFKFMEIFNAPKATISKLRKGTQNKADKPGDMLWQRKLYFRTAELGQAALTVDELKEGRPTKTHKPRFIISTDGKEFSALDTKADEIIHFDFDKLNEHFDFFLPLAGIDKYKAVEENSADIKAAGRLAKFYDEIVRHNPDWHTPEKRHALNQFMARVLFCLFSEDTGSFKKDLFVKTIDEFGGDDGGQIQTLLNQVFDVMNVPNDNRGNIPAHIRAFPYVNGGLFAEQTEVPAFNKRAKRVLVEAARLDWREISPDIFGSMIQAVVDDEMRGDLGMHYTSVPNIMKVLQPLFLMPLEEEFASAREHRNERSMLSKLLNRISKIRVFDPACGSGNFLIIAYRELRSLEMRIFQREDELKHGQSTHRWRSNVQLKNYYGIEVADFPAETAKLSLWIIEYQMNQKFRRLFGEAPPDFPLKEGGHIIQGNALRMNWLEVCPPLGDKKTETYIVGNPPYLGGKKLSKVQIEDMELAGLSKMKQVDYIGCWFFKATKFCQGTKSSFAFVSTSSICQGEQVHLLWSYIFQRGLEIVFAYEPFPWSNNAKNNAGVVCTIIGVKSTSDKSRKVLYLKGHSKQVDNISPYLIEGDSLFVTPVSKPLNNFPEMCMGSNPVDGKHLVVTVSEYKRVISEMPEAQIFFKRYMGGNDFMSSVERHCLWIKDDLIDQSMKVPFIKHRVDSCRQYRLGAGRDARKVADKAYRFCYRKHQEADAIIFPKTSADSRVYVPVGFTDQDTVINVDAFAIYYPEPYIFALISSKMHNVWLATTSGRLGLTYRYSVKLSYNNFPVPVLTKNQKQILEDHTWSIIEAREAHVGKKITWLYDAKTMPENLLAAHTKLDDTLEKIYIGRPFKDDAERLGHLFKLYEEMTANKDKEASSA
jgi:hypothetical protein